MSKSLPQMLFMTLLAISASVVPAHAEPFRREEPKDIGFIKLDRDITLRRMVVHNPKPIGTVLLLHGFPETLYAWQAVAQPLAKDYEVHAFDWPGYGLSSRPPADKFSYAPKDYARVLKGYIRRAGIDRSNLIIYASDIGALPALLLALEEPGIAKRIVVGDFAPFDRSQYLYPSLKALKSPQSAEQVRRSLNGNHEDLLANGWRRGLPTDKQFEVSNTFKDDVFRGWTAGKLTSGDAFFHYYSHFTRDQNYLESHMAQLKTPVTVMWGEHDAYINPAMGAEFAQRLNTKLILLHGIGHYPHLQSPQQVVDQIKVSFR